MAHTRHDRPPRAHTRQGCLPRATQLPVPRHQDRPSQALTRPDLTRQVHRPRDHARPRRPSPGLITARVPKPLDRTPSQDSRYLRRTLSQAPNPPGRLLLGPSRPEHTPPKDPSPPGRPPLDPRHLGRRPPDLTYPGRPPLAPSRRVRPSPAPTPAPARPSESLRPQARPAKDRRHPGRTLPDLPHPARPPRDLACQDRQSRVRRPPGRQSSDRRHPARTLLDLPGRGRPPPAPIPCKDRTRPRRLRPGRSRPGPAPDPIPSPDRKLPTDLRHPGHPQAGGSRRGRLAQDPRPPGHTPADLPLPQGRAPGRTTSPGRTWPKGRSPPGRPTPVPMAAVPRSGGRIRQGAPGHCHQARQLPAGWPLLRCRTARIPPSPMTSG